MINSVFNHGDIIQILYIKIAQFNRPIANQYIIPACRK